MSRIGRSIEIESEISSCQRLGVGVQGKNGRRAWGGNQPSHVRPYQPRLRIRLVPEVCRQPLEGFQKRRDFTNRGTDEDVGHIRSGILLWP